MRLQTIGWRSILLASLLNTPTLAKKDAPGISKSEFHFIPWGVQYFDDSDVIMFEDRKSRQVYRSENAGESWKPLSDVPEGELFQLQMHPFDNKKAYVITPGKSHWKTSDRGKSWQEFKTEKMASDSRPALTFHAGDSDRIIYNAMDCTAVFCDDIVSLPEGGKRTLLIRTSEHVHYGWLF
jgi:hypothetical protein